MLTVHRFVTLFADHDGSAHAYAPVAFEQVTEHAVFAVALYFVPVPDVVRPAGHAVHLVDALDFSLYDPWAQAVSLVAPVVDTYLPSAAAVRPWLVWVPSPYDAWVPGQ